MGRFEVYDEIKVRKMGKEQGYMGSFSTLNEAKAYIGEYTYLLDDPDAYYFYDTEKDEYIHEVTLTTKQIAMLCEDANKQGRDFDEYVNEVITEGVKKIMKEKVQPELGQLWKYGGSEDLYVVANEFISDCGYYTLVNLTTGNVGPIWEDLGPMLEDLEFVAQDIEEYADKVGEDVEIEYDDIDEDDEEELEDYNEDEDDFVYDSSNVTITYDLENSDDSQIIIKELPNGEHVYVNTTKPAIITKVLQVDTVDGGNYEYHLVFDPSRYKGTFHVECYFARGDQTWAQPGELNYSFCLGNFEILKGKPLSIFETANLLKFLDEYYDKDFGCTEKMTHATFK